MSLVYTDSLAHFSDISQKWLLVGDNQITFSTVIARTNTACLQVLSGSSGPSRLLPANFTRLIAQVAFKLDSPGPSQETTIMQFQVAGVGYNIALRVLGDSSFNVWRGNPNDGGSVRILASTKRAALWNRWNYCIVDATFHDTNGTVTLWVNGQMVGTVSGVRTTAQLGSAFSNAFQLYGAALNGALSFLADLVIINPLVAPDATTIPGAKVYVTTPDANAAPVQWTPSAGTNFQNATTIPPVTTQFNSSSTVGELDQYAHPLPVGIQTITAVQHCMCIATDAGTVTCSSVVNAIVGPAFGLTTSAYAIKCSPLDTNPGTGFAWDTGDFPASAGPEVTA